MLTDFVYSSGTGGCCRGRSVGAAWETLSLRGELFLSRLFRSGGVLPLRRGMRKKTAYLLPNCLSWAFSVPPLSTIFASSAICQSRSSICQIVLPETTDPSFHFSEKCA